MEKDFVVGMKGRYSQYKYEDGIRFFEIHACEYDKEILDRLKKMNSLGNSKLAEYTRLIEKPIPDSTRFIYKLQTYIGRIGIDDLWEFNNNISNYEEFGFLNIEELLFFCNSKWGIVKEDFKPIEETNIPH